MWAGPNACRALEDAFETYEDACGACEHVQYVGTVGMHRGGRGGGKSMRMHGGPVKIHVGTYENACAAY